MRILRMLIPLAAGTVLAGGLMAAAAVPASAATASPAITCAGGYAPWALKNGSTFYYLNSEGNGNEDELSTTAGSCWHVPASGNLGTITNEGGLCADYYGGVVISFTCNGAQAEQWSAADQSGGSVVFANEYALGRGLSPFLGEVDWFGVSLISSPVNGRDWYIK